MTSIESKPNHRILVIDDNAAIHEDFRKVLGGSNQKQPGLDAAEASLFGATETALPAIHFEIDSAYQGREGLEMVRQALAEGRPYSMAFVDVRMPPGWDGIETISHLWQDYPELQVVICTAYSDYSWDDIRRVLGETESLVILKKPFDNVEVLQLAHTLTKKWLLARQARIRMDELDRLVSERTIELKEANGQLQKEVEERQHIEAALRLSEERFAKAFRASPIPLAIQALSDQRFVDVNDSFVRMAGYTWEELLRSGADAPKIHADPALLSAMLAELKETKSIRNRECKMKTKADDTRDVLLSMEFLDLGAEPHALIIAHDITERLNLENQLRQAQKMEAVGQLAAGVAHDFNNILTVIQGHTSLLLAKNNLSQEMGKSLNQVSIAAERAASLTRQLLAFSRKQIMQTRILDLNEAVRNLTRMLPRLIGEHVTICEKLQEGLLQVRADATNLDQVVMNLAVNARDAMPKGGRLLFKTATCLLDAHAAALNPDARPGHFATVSVTDTGCGMSSEVLKRVFEPFFTTKDVGKGTGLGLATAYGILKQHEGWIEASSKLGAGTTFTFYLPLIAQVSSSGPAPAAPSQYRGTPSQTGRMLVVDDEEPLRNLVCDFLRQQGYNVFSAETGTHALRVWEAEKGRFDLLLTDVLMPDGLSGPALAGTLLTKNPRLKVIFTSGNADAEALSQNGAVFLPKPYSMEKLAQLVHQSLDREPVNGETPPLGSPLCSSRAPGGGCMEPGRQLALA